MKRFLAALAMVGLALGASSYVVTPTTILVSPTVDLQAAINSLASVGRGGIIQLGPGVFTMTTPIVLPDYPPISIIGSGRWSTQLDFSAINKDSSCITVKSGYVTIADFMLKGQGTSGAGYGIRVVRGNDSTKTANGISGPNLGTNHSTYRGLYVYNTASSDLYVAGLTEPGYVNVLFPPYQTTVEDCLFQGSLNTGTPLIQVNYDAVLWRFIACSFQNYYNAGVTATNTDGIYFDKCVFGDNGPTTSTFLTLTGTRQSVVRDCWFEGNNPSAEDTTYYKVLLQPNTGYPYRGTVGAHLENCFFATGYKHIRAIKSVGLVGSAKDDGLRITNCWAVVDSTGYVDGNSIFVGDSTHAVTISGGGVHGQQALPVFSSWGIRRNPYTTVGS